MTQGLFLTAIPVASNLCTHACPTPAWLPGGHAQTLYSALFSPRTRINFVRDRVELPDGDFIDMDWVSSALLHDPKQHADNRLHTPDAVLQKTAARRWMQTQDRAALHTQQAPALILFHGLEGSSRSHYAQALAQYFSAHGWIVVVAHFRSCSGFPNRLARAYHAGDSADAATMLAQALALAPKARWHALGVSLGGNVLLRMLGEQHVHTQSLRACAAISVPMDLRTCGRALSYTPMGRRVYSPYFLRTMRQKLREKAQHFPDAIDLQGLAHAKTLYDLDDTYTAPVHGYRNALHYWETASSLPLLRHIAVPTLILNARNDPFVPAACLPRQQDVSSRVLLHQPAQGGHAGFTTGRFPGHSHWLTQRIARFFEAGD